MVNLITRVSCIALVHPANTAPHLRCYPPIMHYQIFSLPLDFGYVCDSRPLAEKPGSSCTRDALARDASNLAFANCSRSSHEHPKIPLRNFFRHAFSSLGPGMFNRTDRLYAFFQLAFIPSVPSSTLARTYRVQASYHLILVYPANHHVRATYPPVGNHTTYILSVTYRCRKRVE